jgi:hypothetical protein
MDAYVLRIYLRNYLSVEGFDIRNNDPLPRSQDRGQSGASTREMYLGHFKNVGLIPWQP